MMATATEAKVTTGDRAELEKAQLSHLVAVRIRGLTKHFGTGERRRSRPCARWTGTSTLAR